MIWYNEHNLLRNYHTGHILREWVSEWVIEWVWVNVYMWVNESSNTLCISEWVWVSQWSHRGQVHYVYVITLGSRLRDPFPPWRPRRSWSCMLLHRPFPSHNKLVWGVSISMFPKVLWSYKSLGVRPVWTYPIPDLYRDGRWVVVWWCWLCVCVCVCVCHLVVYFADVPSEAVPGIR